MEAPLLIENDYSSITIGWKKVINSSVYELQIKANQDEMTTLSSNSKIIEPPTQLLSDAISITIQWNEISGATGYLCRYRDDDHSKPWVYIDSVIKSNTMRKKNLIPNKQYFFSIKPIVDNEHYEYSLSSIGLSVSVLSPFLNDLLPKTLLSKSGIVNTSDALAGKIVGIYFSAHWCGPCRSFTPQLSQLYLQAKSLNKSFEIIFCSGDHDEKDFKSYYNQSMPWLAIDFNDDKREELMSKFQVTGIPKLSILATSGKFIDENAVAVYKPMNYSSANIVAKIKYILQNGEKSITNVKRNIKVGHGGTLDPLAQGVIVLGVGKGTQLLSEYLIGSKGYKATGILGSETNTLDCTGEVIKVKDCSHITIDRINQELIHFRGNITQIPPMFSALNRGGVRLYELARKGIEVERTPRDVTVYSLELDKHQPGLPYFNLLIECSGGFYVRSLISDLAVRCDGLAHMTDLIRTKQGIFEIDDCIYEDEWEYDKICDHIRKCSLKVGLDS
eukprot:gene18468-24178_t